MSESFICPSPLVSYSSEIPGTITIPVVPNCAIPCPSLNFNHNQWQFITNSVLILIFISLVSSAGVFFTHISEFNKFYCRIMFAGGFLAYSMFIAMFMIIDGQHNQIICESNAHFVTKNGFCVFQAAMTIWFFSWTEVWSVILVYDVYCKLHHLQDNKKTQKMRLRISTCCGILIPTIITLIPLLADNLGFDTEANIPICLYLVSETNVYFWYSFVIPMYLLVMISLSLMIACAWRIHRVFIESKHYESAINNKLLFNPLINNSSSTTQDEWSRQIEQEENRSELNQDGDSGHSSQLFTKPYVPGTVFNPIVEDYDPDYAPLYPDIIDEHVQGDEVSSIRDNDSAAMRLSLPSQLQARNSFDANFSFRYRGSEVESTVSRSDAEIGSVVTIATNQQTENSRVNTDAAILSAARTDKPVQSKDSEAVGSTNGSGWVSGDGIRLNALPTDHDFKSYRLGSISVFRWLPCWLLCRNADSDVDPDPNSKSFRYHASTATSRSKYVTAIWVYHRRSILFVMTFLIMSLCLLPWLYKLFYVKFEDYVDSGEAFASCLVYASAMCPVQTQEGVNQCALDACGSRPADAPKVIEVSFVIGWMAAYGMIPSVVLGFNGKAVALVSATYKRCFSRPASGPSDHERENNVDRRPLLEKPEITSEII